MRYWKQGIVVGACAIGCAAPLIFGTAAGGLGAVGLGLLGLSEIGMVAAVATLGGGFLVWWSLSRTSLTGVSKGCGCAPTSGCNTGNACDVPETTMPQRAASAPVKTTKERMASTC